MVSGRRKSIPEDEQVPLRPPAKTPEGRENQLVNLAVNLAEKQLRDGSASSQVITHFLKLGTAKEKLEQAKLENENLLLQAKVNHIASSASSEQMYADALAAMRRYSGQDDPREPQGDPDEYY